MYILNGLIIMTTITIEELEEAFSLFDENEDGILSNEEFNKLIDTFNININQNFEDDYYSFENFRSVIDQYINIDISIEDVKEAFNNFESFKDGMIDVKEFLNLMQTYGDVLTPDELQEVIREFSNDGKINVKDIIKII